MLSKINILSICLSIIRIILLCKFIKNNFLFKYNKKVQEIIETSKMILKWVYIILI